jgi:hypothetical protein
MPRKSAADLATISAVPLPREPPPRHMPPDEAAIWRQVTESLPAHWFPGASFVLLEIYCAAVVNMRVCRGVMLAKPESTKAHQQAARLYHDEARTVVRLAKTLRLGPRHDRTKLRAVPNLPKPWELGGASAVKDNDVFEGFGFDEVTEALAKAKPPDPEDSPAA